MDIGNSLNNDGLTRGPEGDIRIGDNAFGSLDNLKATMVHEYAHLILDRKLVNGVFEEWIYTNDVINDMNVPEHWYYDGPSGYPNEVFNAGKLHIGIVGNNHPVRDYWKITNGMKPYYLMPRRFNTQVVVKPFKF